MTNPGLNQRLRQRSRRAGLMIGISMALTIGVCVAGFSFIYAALDDTVGDFVARDVPEPVIPTQPPTEPAVAQTGDVAEAPEEPLVEETEAADEPDEAAPDSAAEETEEPEATEDPDAFTPDYLSSETARLNFRDEPSTDGGPDTVIVTLEEGTPLQFTGETQASTDPAIDGEEGWFLFQLEDGREGWLRAIDVEEIEP